MEKVDKPQTIQTQINSYDSVSVKDFVFDDSQNQSGNSQEENTNHNSESSYAGSHKSDSELDLYSDEKSIDLSQTSESKDQPAEDLLPSSGSVQPNGSLPAHVEDNSDDSEYEEDDVSESEHLKLQIDFDSSQPKDENEGSVERSQNVLENSLLTEKTEDRKMKDLSSPAPTLKLDAGDYYDEDHKREKDLVAAADVSDANSNRQVDKVEEICSEKSDDKKIEQGKIFGSQNVFSLQLNNLKSSQQICQDEKVSAVADDCSEPDIFGQRSVDEPGIQGQTSVGEPVIEGQRNTDEQNVCEQRSVCALEILAQTCVDELNVRRQTSVGESDNDEHKENTVGEDVNSNMSLNGNSVESYRSAEKKTIDNDEPDAKTDREEYRSVTEKEEKFDHFDFKLPELEESLFSPKQNKKHKLNNDEEEGDERSRDKYCKTDLDNVKLRLHERIPLEENNVVEASNNKEMSQMKLQAGKTKKCQNNKPPSGSQILDSNSCRRAGADETLQEKNHLIKCDNTRSSFHSENKKYHQSFNSKDMSLHEGNVQSSLDNRVSPIVFSLDDSVMAGTDINFQKSKEINLSREREFSNNQRKLVVEISDSEDECIAIDSDSDITIPPSPGFPESSQELFSSTDAITDPLNISDMTDNDEVIFIKTSTPIQNGPGRIKKRKNSIINLD